MFSKEKETSVNFSGSQETVKEKFYHLFYLPTVLKPAFKHMTGCVRFQKQFSMRYEK